MGQLGTTAVQIKEGGTLDPLNPIQSCLANRALLLLLPVQVLNRLLTKHVDDCNVA
jgi:hypothetical protein